MTDSKVRVVEDSPTRGTAVSLHLTSCGHQVDGHETANSASSELKPLAPTFSGLELIDSIRSLTESLEA
jgi:hypothetical protein